ncbi:hypothetical protein Tco_0887544 [Tanacetum coccineum]
MVENQLIIQKQIDMQKQVVELKNVLEPDLEDDLPEVADPEVVVEKIADQRRFLISPRPNSVGFWEFNSYVNAEKNHNSVDQTPLPSSRRELCALPRHFFIHNGKELKNLRPFTESQERLQ